MDTTQDSVMVALIPSTDDWCRIFPAHTTIVYPGKVVDLDPIVHDELIKLASSVAVLTPPFPVKIIGQEPFGEERVEVFRLVNSPELTALRKIFAIWDDSGFPAFVPHATIGPEGTIVENPPMYLWFNRIMVDWGGEETTFWLRRG